MHTDHPTPITLDWASSDVRRILGRLLDGGELSVDDGIRLTETHGRDFQALTLVADEMRRRQVQKSPRPAWVRPRKARWKACE